MQDFQLYFQMGLEHLTDLNGWDHMAFLVVLAAGNLLKDWKKVLVLATAFTLGHSLTLATTAMGLRVFPSEVVEVMIPVTILLSAAFNFVTQVNDRSRLGLYLLALVFGLVHGMGFAGYFSSLLMGMGEGIAWPLFAFNVGIEVGQIAILLVFLVMGTIAVKGLGLSLQWWRKGVSLLGGLAGLYLLLRTLLEL